MRWLWETSDRLAGLVLRRHAKGKRSSKHRADRSVRRRSHQLESLEERTLLSIGAWSGEKLWLDFDVSDGLGSAAAAEVEWVGSATGSFVGEVSIPGAWLEPVTLGGMEFAQLTVPGAGYTGEVGEPQLPIIRRLITVPDGAEVTAEMTGEAQLLSLADLGIGVGGIGLGLAPVQASVVKLPGALEAATLSYNTSFYEANAFAPQPGVRVVESGYLSGQRQVMLEIAPIAYNPVTEAVSVYDTLTVDVSFKGGVADAVPPAAKDAVPPAAKDAVPPAAKDAVPEAGGRLLVVAHDDFFGDMAGYVAHKTALGWTVDLVGTSTTGATNTEIRDYIRSRYDNVATRPVAVLLVGDTDRIPHFVGSGEQRPATDLYYGTMDDGDDWYPELPVGRFSVANGIQLADVIEKTISYETSPADSWTTHTAFLAGRDNYQVSEGTHNWVIDQHMDRLGYVSDKLYETTYGANTQDVRDALNDGRMIGVYSGHGGTYSWADGPRFTQTDVRNLANAEMYPLIASFACITGTYTVDESFMETWLRVPDKGAVVAVGSSVNSYWDEDDILEKRLFDAIYDEGITAYASAWMRAKELYLQHFGVSARTRSYFEMYNVMGDPTVEVRGLELAIRSPADLPVAYLDEPYQYALQADGGTEPYTWTVIDGALPADLSLDSTTGIIGGTAAVDGTATFTVEARDDDGATDSRQFHLPVVARLQIATPSELPAAPLGVPYSVTLEATGGTTPYSWSMFGTGQYDESDPGSGYLGGGTPQGWQEDDGSWLLSLPWDFNFYGNDYNAVYVSSNGFLDFASSASDFSNTEAELLQNVRIAPLWDDLVTTGGDVYVTETADYVAVRWDAAVFPDADSADFEVVLLRSGDIRFNYGAAHSGLSATIGISAGNSTDYTLSIRDGATAVPANVSSLLHFGGVMPAGLVFDETTARISGTPAELGPFEISFRVRDAGTPQQTDAKDFTLEVLDLPSIAVTLPQSATEGDGLLAGQGTLSVPAAVPADVVVRLESNDPTELTLPAATATILQGQTSATFDLQIEDDALLDGTQTVEVTASATGYNGGNAELSVHDGETATLTVTLPESATEGDGTLTRAGQVAISAPPDEDILVRLSSDDSSELRVPETMIIRAGYRSGSFDLTILDDAIIDGAQTATVTAHVENWTDGQAAMDVLDDDGRISVQLPAKVWEGQGTLPGAGTVVLDGTSPVDLDVTLTSDDPSELTVPAMVTIPAGQTSVPFDLIVIDDTDYDGSQPVRVSASVAGLSGGSDFTDVGDDDVHHFAIDPIADPQTAEVPFDVALSAKDIGGETIEVYTGTVDLTASGDSGFLPIEIRPPAKPTTGGGTQSDLPSYEPAPAADPKVTLGVYHDYAALTADLAEYAAAYPAITQLVSIGQSVEGRELWALKISDNPDVEEDEPEFKYASTMHGDEVVGVEMSLYFINELLTGYRSDPRITDLIDETEIWVLPLINPDGREAGTRYNANSVDLNRNFPEGANTPIGNVFDGPPMNFAGLQPETVRVMQFSAEHSFSLSANFHGGALVVNYPYDNDGLGSVFSPSPDEDLFQYLAETYSAQNAPMYNSPTFPRGITNGAEWYSINGGMQDWLYRYLSSNEVTIEVSSVKWPSESTLPGFWADNRESMLSYAEAVHMGARGVVTDALTGLPVYASVTVAGNTHPVFTDPDVGDFHRLLLPGTYDLTFTAPGYNGRTVRGVEVQDGGAIDVDVALVPEGAGIVFTDGQWVGRVAIHAVDTNVALTADDGDGHAGVSNPFDAVSGPVDHFELSPIDSPKYANQPFTLTVTARDANGYTVESFDQGVSIAGWIGAGTDSSVVISEVDTADADAVEFTNVSGSSLDVSGWQITVYDWDSFPSPRDTVTIPSGTTVAAGDVFLLYENGISPGTYPNFYTEENIYWNDNLTNNQVVVLLQDDAGNVVDVMGAVDTDLTAITDPIAIPSDQWVGAPIPGEPDPSRTYQRIGNEDHHDNGDWTTAAGNIGSTNPGMTLPFGGGRVPVGVSPPVTGALAGGIWTGEVTVHEPAMGMALQIDDGNGRTAVSNTFGVAPAAAVVDRHVFYNHSAFDGNDPAASPSDDGAIATDKEALLPGETAAFANYTSYHRGINGIMIDVFGLTAAPTLDDFRFRVGNDDDPGAWAAAPDPISITVRPGEGVAGSDRVTVIFDDFAVTKQWLQVTMAATPITALPQDDVFYFGNTIGESGNSTTEAKVTSLDMLAARNNQRNFTDPAPVDFSFDFNRDARVNATDMLIARNNTTHFLNALKLITPADKGVGWIADPSYSSSPVESSAWKGPQVAPGRLSWLAEFESSEVRIGKTDWQSVLQRPAKNKTPTAESVDRLFSA